MMTSATRRRVREQRPPLAVYERLAAVEEAERRFQPCAVSPVEASRPFRRVNTRRQRGTEEYRRDGDGPEPRASGHATSLQPAA